MVIRKYDKLRKLRLKITAIDLDNVPHASSNKKVPIMEQGRYYFTIGTEFYIRNEIHSIFIDYQEFPILINFLFWNINPAFTFRDLRKSYYNGSYAILFLADNLNEATFSKILYYFLESVNTVPNKTPYYIIVRNISKQYNKILSNIFGDRLRVKKDPFFIK